MNILNLSNYFKEKTFLAHRDFSSQEYLEEHLNLLKQYYHFFKIENCVEKCIEKINQSKKDTFPFDENEKELISFFFFHSIYFHDLGKLNPQFQLIKMNNPLKLKMELKESIPSDYHSIYSSIMYLYIMFQQLELEEIQLKNKELLKLFIILFSYCISKHHVSHLFDFNLINYQEEINSILNESDNTFYFQNFFVSFDEIKNCLQTQKFFKIRIEEDYIDNLLSSNKCFGNHLKNNPVSISFYTMFRMNLSTIIFLDYISTTQFYQKSDWTTIRFPKKKMIDNFEEDKIIKNIRKFEVDNTIFKKTNINYYRSELFLESQKNIQKHFMENIFYLEAPTGSGKTMTSINLALELLKKDNQLEHLHYIFPFNSLIEQTEKVLSTYITPYEDFVCMNSISYLVKPETKNKKNIYKEYYDYTYLNYPITLMSHVHFFEILFGINKESLMLMSQLKNSVIILDEIQSYPIKTWYYFINLFNFYADVFHIKFIIMSATCPKLNELVLEKNSYVNLIDSPKKYFCNPIFKDRVKIDISWFDKLNIKTPNKQEILLDLFEDLVNNNQTKQICIEFIKKKTAITFYNELEKRGNIKLKLYQLTGNDNHYTRNLILQELKSIKTPYVLVTTQILEAGVDLSFDIGCKDSSYLDSEEQFMGRIARNAEKEGICYFFQYDKTSDIYKEDIRIYESIEKKEIMEQLKEKSFQDYYNKIFKTILDNVNRYNPKNYRNFLKKLQNLKFQTIYEEYLKLIDNQDYIISAFVQDILEITKDGKKIILNTDEIWKEYQDLIYHKNLPYPEFKIEMRNLQINGFDFFMKQIPQYEFENYEIIDKCGSFIYCKKKEIIDFY